jgi:hypothetical protein
MLKATALLSARKATLEPDVGIVREQDSRKLDHEGEVFGTPRGVVGLLPDVGLLAPGTRPSVFDSIDSSGLRRIITQKMRGQESNRDNEHEQQSTCSPDQTRRSKDKQCGCVALDPLLEQYIPANQNEHNDSHKQTEPHELVTQALGRRTGHPLNLLSL